MIDHRVAHAENLLSLGRYTEALALLRVLQAEHPDDGDLHGLRAQALVGLDDWPAALEAGNRVVALMPDDEWGHRICAIALRGLGNHEGAVTAAANAVRLAPLHWQTHLQYAASAMHLPRRMREAEAAALRALELAPHEPKAHFVYGVVAESQRRIDVARAAYQQTLALEPTHAGAQNNLTSLDSGIRLGRQARGYAAVLKNDPGFTPALENLDLVAFRLVRRFYWGALATMVVALIIAGIQGGFSNPDFSWVRAGLGVAVLAGLAAYTWLLARAVPRGVRTHLRSQLTKSGWLLFTALVAGLMVVVAALACFTPRGPELALMSLRVIGLLNVAVVVGGVLRRNSEWG